MGKAEMAVVGGGLIGMSWASLFLARGLNVTMIEPRSGANEAMAHFAQSVWQDLQDLGLATAEAPRAAHVTNDYAAISDADFVTECGPDRIDVKRQILQEIEAVVRPDVIIASSTSSLLASDIQHDAKHPDRVLVAHPMNPPHLVPMVELVAGERTSEDAMDEADAFYRGLDRVTIRVKKEMVGHLANRLTSALYREAVYAVQEGIASVEDVDKAIAYGPGMRWAFMGPHLTYHLGGGSGGYRHYLEHLGPTQEARWREHGMPRLTEPLKDTLVEGVEAELAKQDRDTLVKRRDGALVALAKLKQRFGL